MLGSPLDLKLDHPPLLLLLPPRSARALLIFEGRHITPPLQQPILDTVLCVRGSKIYPKHRVAGREGGNRSCTTSELNITAQSRGERLGTNR